MSPIYFPDTFVLKFQNTIEKYTMAIKNKKTESLENETKSSGFQG